MYKSLPWVEKYRPIKLSSVVGQEEIINLLKKSVISGDLPHLLLYGPPGTGKTSTIFSFAMELFGPINFKARVVEVNASDERGINVVRNKIIEFTNMEISTPDKNYNCPNYKLIILDEADTLTNEAQNALRKVLEENSRTTRFCFLCNYLNRIIDPIISRCNKYYFKPLNKELIIEKINFIANKENIDFSQDVINLIAEINEGDMRRSVSVLQNLKYFDIYKKSLNEKILPDDVREICGLIPYDIEKIIIDVCFNKKSTINDIKDLTQKIMSNSYTIYSVIDKVLHFVLECKLCDIGKSKIIMYFLDIERQLLAGSDEYLQLLSLLTFIHKIIQESESDPLASNKSIDLMDSLASNKSIDLMDPLASNKSIDLKDPLASNKSIDLKDPELEPKSEPELKQKQVPKKIQPIKPNIPAKKKQVQKLKQTS